MLEKLGHEVFKYDCLDRQLNRHQITGIAFSGAVGIGLFQTSGQIIALGGPVGALLAFFFAGLVIFSVMRSLAELVSVRPVKGPIIDYPDVFVDEALGFAVGIMYWLANCMSMVTLTIAAAMFTQYWGPGFGLTSATFVLLIFVMVLNSCGVRLYGYLEWAFKWVKILLIILLCITMIAIKAGAGSKSPPTRFELAPGYSSTGFPKDVAIPGTGGQILAVWTCLTLAMFQFMGGEMVLVTSAEAISPRRDLPTAARYMYMLPVGFYLVAVFLVGLCIDYEDPRLVHPHVDFVSMIGSRLNSMITVERSPFGIVTVNAGIRVLPGFLNAGFLFSAITAANSALYASSRTLFFLSARSSSRIIKQTTGRTNNGHTPLAAIFVSFLPGFLAFLVVGVERAALQEPVAVFSRLYTGPVLCIYASECIAFLRFMKSLKYFPHTIDRQTNYKPYYRAHWQPLWAMLGLVLCTMLVLTLGWTAIYDFCANDGTVPKRDSIADLATAYIGPFLFFVMYLGYKLVYKTRIRTLSKIQALCAQDELVDESDAPPRKSRHGEKDKTLAFLSWIV